MRGPYKLATEFDGGDMAEFGDAYKTIRAARSMAKRLARNLTPPRETAILIVDSAGEIVDSAA